MKRFYNFCLFCAIFFLISAGFTAAQEASEQETASQENKCADSGLTVTATPQPPVRTFIPPVPPALHEPNGRSGAAGGISIKIVPQMPDPHSKKVYRIQVGSFSNTDLAWRSYDRLKDAGLAPAFELHEKNYRVVLPGVQAANIPEIARKLESAGFTEAWVREEN